MKTYRIAKTLVGRGAVLFTAVLIAATVAPQILSVKTVAADDGGYPWVGATQLFTTPVTYDWGYSTCPSNDTGCMGVTKVYNGTTYGEEDPYTEDVRNCTSYAAWKINQYISQSFSGWGNASNWHNKAPSGTLKTPSTYTPVFGDLALWDSAAGGLGHVAFVSSVNQSGIASLDEYNSGYPLDANNHAQWGLFYSGETTASNSRGTPDYYIHLSGISGTSGPNLGQMGTKAPLDDFVIWRIMNGSDGTWYAAENKNNVANGLLVNGWIHGSPGDIPFTADFTGDKIADFGIYRLVNGVGTWYVEDGVTHAHTAIWGVQLGQSGDVPVVGDIDGDGYADFGVWRLVNGTDGTWYINSGATGQHTAIWGAVHGSPGDIPVVGDFNGDGYADFGIYRLNSSNSTGYWYFKSSATGQQIPSAWGVTHGSPGDTPVVGDFNGDGYSDFGIYRPIGGTGYWYVKSGANSNTMLINGAMQGGWAGDVPLAGNFG